MNPTHPAVDAYERAYTTPYADQVPLLVAEAFTEDGILESPYLTGEQVRGHQALTDHILRTRSRLTGTTSALTSVIERIGDTLRWSWAFTSDGEVIAEGLDVAILSGDRMARLVVFDGVTPQSN